MDFNTISHAVGSVGFPIVACCVMFYQNSKLQDTLKEMTGTLVSISERLSDVENEVKKGGK